jgi:pimeloyl-ACP methyl ester carboxylesterase
VANTKDETVADTEQAFVSHSRATTIPPMRSPKGIVAVVLALVALGIGWGEPVRGRPLHRAEWLEAGGLQLRALRDGSGDTTLFFLHGYGESLLSWRLILDRFTRHYRVVAIDLPGFGLSDKPAGPYDAQAMQSVLDDFLLRWTTGPVVVVGHSMGGQLAAQLALAHPDRIVALVLIAPTGAGISPLFSDSSGIASAQTLWVANAIGYVLPLHDPSWLAEPNDRAKYSTLDDSSARLAARTVLQQFDFSAVGRHFADLHQPVLLIWGRNDPTVPYRIGESIAQLLPCRRFTTLPTTLHRPHQTAPDTVAAEMEAFLKHPGCDST